MLEGRFFGRIGRIKKGVDKMILMKFLKEWNGHSPENSTYQYVDELQAERLIKKGIAESVDGTTPQRPHNFIMGAIK